MEKLFDVGAIQDSIIETEEVVKKYETTDGKKFDIKRDAFNHQRKLDAVEKFNKMFDAYIIKDIDLVEVNNRYYSVLSSFGEKMKLMNPTITHVLKITTSEDLKIVNDLLKPFISRPIYWTMNDIDSAIDDSNPVEYIFIIGHNKDYSYNIDISTYSNFRNIIKMINDRLDSLHDLLEKY